MKIKTLRFGELDVNLEETVYFPEGILGFPDLHRYCLVDPGDDTLILWMQSLEDANIAFPVLEPKIFKSDYIVKLSAQELKQLKLENINQSIVFAILTIPKDVTQMTANLKAPIVVNLSDQVGRQVVLQENEYTLKHLMFKELKAQLTTIQATKAAQAKNGAETKKASSLPINLRSMVPSSQVKSL